MKKKLIEVTLPLEKINAESAREKSIRHGHPSTLHLWWARRPLAAARAVIWASLVDDPSSHPEQFPTEEEQDAERRRLFDILEKLVVWENSNDPDILDAAKAEILKSTDGHPPALLDPFAGGGAIPLEAQRLGLEAHAHDLNPVAVMINKAMIEIPPKYAGLPPVNPEARSNPTFTEAGWNGAAGLAEDVRYYGEWMKREAWKRIGHLYPKVKVPQSQGGGEATVIAWIWARTVKCPNPACGCDMPLASSFVLSKKKGNEAYVEPQFDGGETTFKVHQGSKHKLEGTITRKGAVCASCGTPVDFSYIREEGKQGRIDAKLMAVVAEGKSRRIYLSPDEMQVKAANVPLPEDYPTAPVPSEALGFRVQLYGFDSFDKLFTHRQLTTLSSISSLVSEAKSQVEHDASKLGVKNAIAYGQAVSVYLTFLLDKMVDYHSSVCSWHNSGEKIRNTFGRQAISMIWDYAEANPFCNSSGSFSNMLEWIEKCVKMLPAGKQGYAQQFNAQTDCGLTAITLSTDPPYYDNIGYADLSDYFYMWMRQSLRTVYPELFAGIVVPKEEELIAAPYRHNGSMDDARNFFENGMFNTCKQIYKYALDDIPVSIYYAYKQSDLDADNNSASTGWETMLNAVIQAGFIITGTWPVRTELANRNRGIASNALASSIVLVCRKRPENAPMTTRRNLVTELRRELRPALRELQKSNIAPVDLAQSAIGPGMAVFSKYRQVLESDGTPMTVRAALQIINKELDVFFNEQDNDLDRDSRFCVELYTQFAFGEMKFGEADILARAKNTSVAAMETAGVVYAQKGIVRLLGREEISEEVNPTEPCLWRLTQQLTRGMETNGVQGSAKVAAAVEGNRAERARDLAYRLFTIAERKGWTAEAYAYNNLVISWQEIQKAAMQIASEQTERQMEIGL